MSSHDLIEVLVPILSYPHRYATPANKWTVQITPHLPNWLMVSDPQAVERYWIGGSDFWRSGDWRVWLRPAVYWTLFLDCLVVCGSIARPFPFSWDSTGRMLCWDRLDARERDPGHQDIHRLALWLGGCAVTSRSAGKSSSARARGQSPLHDSQLR